MKYRDRREWIEIRGRAGRDRSDGIGKQFVSTLVVHRRGAY